MVSGIRFFGGSGTMGQLTTGRLTPAAYYAAGGNLPADRARPNLEIFQMEAGATDSPNRVGFFGVNGAPNSAVIVGQYQDSTFRTDHVGTDLGRMINAKFTGASLVEHSGVAYTAGTFVDIPSESGTLLCRFAEPNGTAVITQSATFRAVNFTAASGVPDISDLATGITIQCAQLADTDGFAGATAWSEISSGGAALTLQDQSAEANIHDFHLMLSGTPSAAGRKIDFGYFLQLEFL